MSNISVFPVVRLEEVVEILDHLRIPVNEGERLKRVGDVPYYGANGQQGWIDKSLFNEPLILLAEDGGNFDAFATRAIAYRVDGHSWVNNHAHIMRAKAEVCQSFIFWSIVNKDIRQFIAGGTRTKLTQGELRRIEISLPDKAEQKQIAQILDTIDTAIQQTQAIINKLKQLKQGLLHDLLTRGVGANGELRPCYEDAPHLYKESPLGWIPKEWEVKGLDSISSTVTSGSRDWARFYADTGALFVRIGNLTREHINFRYDSVIYVNPPANGDGQRTRLEAGDILISITADLGIIGVVGDTMGEAYINQHIALVRPVYNDVNSRYIGHYLCSSQAQNYISKLNDGGAKSGLNLPTIRSLEISLPLSRVEQDCIATQLDNIDNQIQTSKQELEKLKSTKSGLMDDLLTGRVRVSSLLQAEASSA